MQKVGHKTQNMLSNSCLIKTLATLYAEAIFCLVFETNQFVKVSREYQHRHSLRTNIVFIFGLYNEVFTTERVTLTKNLLYYYETRMA